MLFGFKRIWLVDFEFGVGPGERPQPICMVALELHTKRCLRVWFDDERSHSVPYPFGNQDLYVAYYASAELGCHLALGWPMPSHILDLFVEFRNRTNGMSVPCGNGLIGAMVFFGLWFFSQFLIGDGNLAWEAHVVGFTSGILVTFPFRRRLRGNTSVGVTEHY